MNRRTVAFTTTLVFGVLFAFPRFVQAQAEQGEKGGACYGNQTCNAGLSCDPAQNVCVDQFAEGALNGPCYGNGTCDDNLACDTTRGICVVADEMAEPTEPTQPTEPATPPAPTEPTTPAPAQPTPAPAQPLAPAPVAAAAPAGPVGTVGPIAKADYPVNFLRRPLTLPQGMLEATFSFVRTTFNWDFLDEAISPIGIGISADYGLTDKFHAYLGTGVSIYNGDETEFDWYESLSLGAGFLVQDSEKLDIEAAVSIPVDVSGDEGVDAISTVGLAARTRLILSDKMAVYFGHGFFYIDLSDPSTFQFNLNGEFAYQASENITVALATRLFTVDVYKDEYDEFVSENRWLADSIPLTLTGIFASSAMLDFGLSLAFADLENAGDLYSLSGWASLRM